MLARARGAARHGVEARVVDVEVDVAPRGVSAFRLIGLPASVARGMEQRLLAALRNCGFTPPSRPVTVNFAPAGLPKEGPPLDLALAVAVLGSSGALSSEACGTALLHGELSLDGRVRPVAGALPAAEAARRAKLPSFACSPVVAEEAAAVRGVAVHPVQTLTEVVEMLTGAGGPPVPTVDVLTPEDVADGTGGPDLADVAGQVHAKRALELAAAGEHGLLFVGPPGAGKSMLARRLPGLLPGLTLDEAVAVTRVHSAAGLLLDGIDAGHGRGGLVRTRPFRAPHHTVSTAGMVGGGRLLVPGESSLAHHGVLFLDELPEFRRDTLEALRQPLEDGVVSVVRVGGRATLPCRFVLVAAMNPCPCGFHGTLSRHCTCTDAAITRYRAKVSGPLLDRLDLQVDVPALRFAELSAVGHGETSADVRARVRAARGRAMSRQGKSNAALGPSELRRRVKLAQGARTVLAHAVDRLGISGRAHDRLLRLALTITDLEAVRRGGPAGRPDEKVELDEASLAEALSYRIMDRGTTLLAPDGAAREASPPRRPPFRPAPAPSPARDRPKAGAT